MGPGLHVDVPLSGLTYINIILDHVHPFMVTVYPKGIGLFLLLTSWCHILYPSTPSEVFWSLDGSEPVGLTQYQTGGFNIMVIGVRPKVCGQVSVSPRACYTSEAQALIIMLGQVWAFQFP